MISYVLKNDKYEMKIPALTFGAAGFERNDCDDVYFEFLDKYVELGGWCIDTARVYCDWLENGHDSSEGVIGRWLKARNNRDKICIATKGGHPELGHMDESRLSREELTKDLEASLRVLGVDYVDIYFLHRDDPKIPVEEIMPVLNDFYESGKIHFIGVSNWTTQRIEEANKFAEKNIDMAISVDSYIVFVTPDDKEIIVDDNGSEKWCFSNEVNLKVDTYSSKINYSKEELESFKLILGEMETCKKAFSINDDFPQIKKNIAEGLSLLLNDDSKEKEEEKEEKAIRLQQIRRKRMKAKARKKKKILVSSVLGVSLLGGVALTAKCLSSKRN